MYLLQHTRSRSWQAANVLCIPDTRDLKASRSGQHWNRHTFNHFLCVAEAETLLEPAFILQFCS